MASDAEELCIIGEIVPLSLELCPQVYVIQATACASTGRGSVQMTVSL